MEGERNLVFYGDDGRIAGKYHIWVKDALMLTVTMFKRVGLNTNIEKTKLLVCSPIYIWGKWIEEAYKCRSTGVGETFRDRNWSRVSCADYGMKVL